MAKLINDNLAHWTHDYRQYLTNSWNLIKIGIAGLQEVEKWTGEYEYVHLRSAKKARTIVCFRGNPDHLSVCETPLSTKNLGSSFWKSVLFNPKTLATNRRITWMDSSSVHAPNDSDEISVSTGSPLAFFHVPPRGVDFVREKWMILSLASGYSHHQQFLDFAKYPKWPGRIATKWIKSRVVEC